jgi:cell volume regulation protein A
VPIILATYPAAAQLPGSQDIFNLVFFAVMLSVLVQGSTLGVVARMLKLLSPRTHPEPLYNLDLITMAPSDMDLMVVDLPEKPGFMGVRIQDLKLPPETVIALITRGAKVISPNGPTRLESGDQVTILAHVRDEEAVKQALLAPFQDD